jgi:hypothetical protein
VEFGCLLSHAWSSVAALSDLRPEKLDDVGDQLGFIQVLFVTDTLDPAAGNSLEFLVFLFCRENPTSQVEVLAARSLESNDLTCLTRELRII